jgi:small subunit ribosomal protein S16
VLVIRLSRAGSKNKPFYRVVVSESARTPRSRITEQIGYYDPKRKPEIVKIDVVKADGWIKKGAHASPSVKRLLEKARASAPPA